MQRFRKSTCLLRKASYNCITKHFVVMNYKPTESELEILQVLWKQGNATVREVNELLSINKNKEVGYTTTLKLMQIMFEKGLLTRDSSSRTHTYKAAVEQKAAQQNLLTKLIDNLFNGSSSQLI